jgi:predicted dehydrogenase
MVGLGSIGRRHVTNIRGYAAQNGAEITIDALRSGAGGAIEEGIAEKIDRVITDRADARHDYDAVFIANPTSLHYETLEFFSGRSRAFFIEKPVFCAADLARPAPKLPNPELAYVACPLRYSDVVKAVRENLRRWKVIHVRAICSSYLPDWRPGADYRNAYSAKRELGGGVMADLIHEWDYLYDLFGAPDEVKMISGKVSALEIDSDDIAVYIAKYPGMTLELHLDYFGREAKREFALYTDDDIITADIQNSRVTRWAANETTAFTQERNIIYEREIAAFFDIINGNRANPNTIEKATRVIRLAMGRNT